jgi:hypothetical protein
MANQKAFEMGLGVPGASAVIWFNDGNLRVGNIDVTVPAGCEATARIWRDGNLVFVRSYLPGSYSETVPGNERMVLVPDPAGNYYDLPAGITWAVNFASIG